MPAQPLPVETDGEFERPVWKKPEAGFKPGFGSDSDKAHSTSETIISPGDLEYTVVNHWRSVAAYMDDGDTVDMLDEIAAMTIGEARKMGQQALLRTVMAAYYEHMQGVMAGWLEDFFTNLLKHIEEVGNG